MKFIPLIILLLGCASKFQLKGNSEVIPNDNASGELRYLNFHEVGNLNERNGTLPKGGRVLYKLAEYALSGDGVDTISVVEKVYGNGKKIAADCTSEVSFTPTNANGKFPPTMITDRTGLKRIEISCNILEEVGSEFLFVVMLENGEKSFRIKTKLKEAPDLK